MGAKVDWMNALKLEQAFFKCLVPMKARGFLVDKELINFHIYTLEYMIEELDIDLKPQLPKRMSIKEGKKAGVYGWLKAPFLKSGKLGQYAKDFCKKTKVEERYIDGPFSRIDYVDMDLGSAAQIKEYLLSQGWKPSAWNFSKDTGKRTSPKLTQDDEFIGVTGTVGALVANRMKHSHRRSLMKGLYRIIREDGRITAGVTGITATGRLKHTGIVNIPGARSVFGEECREVFIAKDGYKLVGCDAASCQLRLLCHYMGDAAYAEAVVSGKEEDGTDVHSVNMRMAGLANRGLAKNLIYALLFGAGDTKLGVTLGCTLREAKEVRGRLMAELPKLGALVKGVTSSWKERGYLIGLDGRKILPRSEHMALVYLLQGAEAVVMKVATCYATNWIEQRGLDAHMVSHVHDEFSFEVKEEEAKEVALILEKAIMKAGEYFKLKVPMGGTAKIGKNWLEVH